MPMWSVPVELVGLRLGRVEKAFVVGGRFVVVLVDRLLTLGLEGIEVRLLGQRLLLLVLFAEVVGRRGDLGTPGGQGGRRLGLRESRRQSVQEAVGAVDVLGLRLGGP